MRVKMHWEYRHPKKAGTIFHSEFIQGEEALFITADLEKTGRAFHIEFEDEGGLTWTKKELKKLLEEVMDEPQDITVYFDGGFQKDEGLASAGVALYYRQNKKNWRIRSNKMMEILDSNNEAEYAALYYALTQLEELGVKNTPCTFKGDSQVVLNQLSGEWPCFEEGLNKWMDRIEEKLRELNIKPNYMVIPRKENQEADKLASQALDQNFISSRLEII
ncbi:reverse transcriptase-like protein [Peribacillus kribbensis]|uniref:reverse transcriptase-like protein n=1 Tax=Peribacillus kribbensis TaxID=356658 RepID=UPI000417DA4C|nr:reverse transcriptase-like protein [Peribacillus kribbensis]